MLVSLRRQYAQLITSGGQIALLFMALQHGEGVVLWAALAVMAAISVVAWTSATRRYRAIDDTPTSRVASAAQGYVELKGIGRPLDGVPVLSPLNQLPCLWYRYTIERKDNDKWVREGADESSASFILDDGTGQCLVDPDQAEMLVTRRDRWHQGNRRYTQWTLLQNDPVYALGEFRTKGALDLHLDTTADVSALLGEWKKDRKVLLERFDLNRDGEVDMREWELARKAAQREVARHHREARAQSDVSVMQRPNDGRMYLVSSLDPDLLARRYRRWSVVHLGFFFLGLGWLAYTWI